MPTSSSDAKPTAYPVDSVDDEVLSGRSIFSVCAAIDVSASSSRIHGWSNAPIRTDQTHAAAPAHITAAIWTLAESGNSRNVN